jgi:hypothetical protein
MVLGRARRPRRSKRPSTTTYALARIMNHMSTPTQRRASGRSVSRRGQWPPRRRTCAALRPRAQSGPAAAPSLRKQMPTTAELATESAAREATKWSAVVRGGPRTKALHAPHEATKTRMETPTAPNMVSTRKCLPPRNLLRNPPLARLPSGARWYAVVRVPMHCTSHTRQIPSTMRQRGRLVRPTSYVAPARNRAGAARSLGGIASAFPRELPQFIATTP